QENIPVFALSKIILISPSSRLPHLATETMMQICSKLPVSVLPWKMLLQNASQPPMPSQNDTMKMALLGEFNISFILTEKFWLKAAALVYPSMSERSSLPAVFHR